MTERLKTGIPTVEEWVEVSMDVMSRIPQPERTTKYTEREGKIVLFDSLRHIHTALIADAYTAQHFFREGRYSIENYAQIRKGIIRTYHVYKESRRLGFLFTDDRVRNIQQRYQHLTGKFNFE